MYSIQIIYSRSTHIYARQDVTEIAHPLHITGIRAGHCEYRGEQWVITIRSLKELIALEFLPSSWIPLPLRYLRHD